MNSPVNGVKDGMGQLSFPADYPVNDVMLVVETSYAEASQSDREP